MADLWDTRSVPGLGARSTPRSGVWFSRPAARESPEVPGPGLSLLHLLVSLVRVHPLPGSQGRRCRGFDPGILGALSRPRFPGPVDKSRGKFRTFLLACCRHFLANQRDFARAQKRGGGQPVLSLDFSAADERYEQEPAASWTAEKLFERRWALTLLDQVLKQLRQEFRPRTKATCLNSSAKSWWASRRPFPTLKSAQQWACPKMRSRKRPSVAAALWLAAPRADRGHR